MHKGNNVLCPICKSQFRIFATYGVAQRENAMCHQCGSMERHRLLFIYLKEKTKILLTQQKSFRLLHFAPEKCFSDIFSKMSNIEYIPCDLEPEKYKYNGHSKIKKVDITNIPLEDNSIDFILCNHVLEHIPNDKLAMQELYRVLIFEGSGIFQVPIDYQLQTTYEDSSITTPLGRENAFGQNDHFRKYGCDYKNKLEQIGFDVKEEDFINSFSKKDKFKYGLLNGELIYFCRKPT